MRAAGALVPVLHQHAANALVDRGHAGDLEHLLVFRHGLGDLEHLVGIGQHLVRSRRRRTHHLGRDQALVLFGRQLGLGHLEHQAQAQEQQHRHHDQHRPGVEQAVQQALVAASHRAKDPVDRDHQHAAVLLAGEDARAHHGRQRQRDHAGHRHRAGQREGEFREQGTGEAALETDGHIDRDQHHGHRQNRAAQFARRHQRCLHRRLAFVAHVAVHVLDHDDGVIHHQADRQHQREQGQQVDRVTQGQHDEEGADQRQRHRNHRHQHGAETAQKQEDHHGDDQQRLDQGLDDLDDGGVDEGRGVVDDLPGQATRQLALNARKGVAHALGHVQDVGLGSHLDTDEHRAHAAEGHVEVVVLRAQADRRHVLQAHDGVTHLLDRQLIEFRDRMQVGAGRQRHRHHLPLGRTQRSQEVVAGQRVADVGRRDVVRRHAVRVQPGAQRKQPPAQDFSSLHTFNRIQLRLDFSDQVVGDVVGWQRIAVETQIHRVGGLAGLHRQHRLLGLGRQLVAHRSHLGVDFGQRAVGVVVQAQRGGDGGDAAAAGRGQVVDPLRLGDGRFQRLRNEAGHGLRVGTEVGGRHRDHGVLRVRVLVDRQAEQRAQPQHHDQQADHRGQHRPADEDVCEIHSA